MKTTAELIAEFAAKGGKVRKVDASATCGMTDRQWYLAARDDTNVRVIQQEDIDAEQLEEIARETFGRARLNGASVNNAMDAYNDVRRNRKAI